MTVPDPDQDILDRREAIKKALLPGLIALAGGCAAGMIAYEISKRAFMWEAPAPLYDGLVVLIIISAWLFAKLNNGR